MPVPGSGKQTDDWSAEAKFAAVIETAPLSESELSEYCRSKGLYPEQIKRWRAACVQGAEALGEQQRHQHQASRQEKKRIKQLERELKRKEKALAEAPGICQDRCRLFDHAARHFSSLLRSGFNATDPTGSQFRVWPDHRAGLAAFACS